MNKIILFFIFALFFNSIIFSQDFSNLQYQVKKGDTLWSISRKFKISINELVKKNNLSDPTQIKLSQTLNIPVKDIHLKFPTFDKNKYEQDKNGIYILGKLNETVLASHSGKVEYIGQLRGFGNTIIIKFNETYKTVYSGFSKTMLKMNDWVKVGQPIAYIGENPRLSQPGIFFALSKNGSFKDPTQYLY